MSAQNDPAVLAIRIEGLQSRIERLEKEELNTLQARAEAERRGREHWELALMGLLVVQFIITLLIIFKPRP